MLTDLWTDNYKSVLMFEIITYLILLSCLITNKISKLFCYRNIWTIHINIIEYMFSIKTSNIKHFREFPSWLYN